MRLWVLHLNTVLLETTTHIRALSKANPMHKGPSRTSTQSLVLCKNLHNTLWHFTPPRTCCWPWECVWFVLGDCSPQNGFPSHQQTAGLPVHRRTNWVSSTWKILFSSLVVLWSPHGLLLYSWMTLWVQKYLWRAELSIVMGQVLFGPTFRDVYHITIVLSRYISLILSFIVQYRDMIWLCNHHIWKCAWLCNHHIWKCAWLCT